MTDNVQLAAVVGSLRADSFNRVMFNAAVELAGDHVVLAEVSLRDVPLYDGDVEAGGDPEAVTALKRAVAAADGLVVFTPEYNRSVPAVTKNAIDWLSRLPGESVLSEATVGIVASTPGRHDAAGVRAHLGASLAANTDGYYEHSLGVASVNRKFTDGRLSDPETRDELSTWLAGFVTYCRERRA